MIPKIFLQRKSKCDMLWFKKKKKYCFVLYGGALISCHCLIFFYSFSMLSTAEVYSLFFLCFMNGCGNMLEFARDRHQGIMIFTFGQPLCSCPLCFYAHVLFMMTPKIQREQGWTGKPDLYANKEMHVFWLILPLFSFYLRQKGLPWAAKIPRQALD